MSRPMCERFSVSPLADDVSQLVSAPYAPAAHAKRLSEPKRCQQPLTAHPDWPVHRATGLFAASLHGLLQ